MFDVVFVPLGPWQNCRERTPGIGGLEDALFPCVGALTRTNKPLMILTSDQANSEKFVLFLKNAFGLGTLEMETPKLVAPFCHWILSRIENCLAIGGPLKTGNSVGKWAANLPRN